MQQQKNSTSDTKQEETANDWYQKAVACEKAAEALQRDKLLDALKKKRVANRKQHTIHNKKPTESIEEEILSLQYQAFLFFGKAAKLGHGAALNNLGWYYRKGIKGYLEPDRKKAFELYLLAAQKEVPPALNNVGWCYEHGVGTGKNFGFALQSYKEAAKHHDPLGLINWVRCVESGIGVDDSSQERKDLFSFLQEKHMEIKSSGVSLDGDFHQRTQSVHPFVDMSSMSFLRRGNKAISEHACGVDDDGFPLPSSSPH